MRITDWIFSTCTNLCIPEEDIHSEECTKKTYAIMTCKYCLDQDDCMVCGRRSKEIQIRKMAE